MSVELAIMKGDERIDVIYIPEGILEEWHWGSITDTELEEDCQKLFDDYCQANGIADNPDVWWDYI